jgi:hypothetical protein
MEIMVLQIHTQKNRSLVHQKLTANVKNSVVPYSEKLKDTLDCRVTGR